MLVIEEEEEESKGSPEIVSGVFRKTSSAVAPATTVLELVDIEIDGWMSDSRSN